MGKTLERLPNELLHKACRHLSPPDLARVSLACKQLNAIAVPLLWTDIELHDYGFHESSNQVRVPPPLQPRSPRLYRSAQRSGPSDAEPKATRLFVTLYSLLHSDPDRLKKLAGRVRSLCTVAASRWEALIADGLPDGLCRAWALLPHFTRLEYLELYGDFPEDDTDMEHLPTPKLRFVKLHGYLPRTLVAWALRAGPTLERLELGLLDNGLPSPQDSDGDSESEDEDLDGKLIPLPLGGFLPTSHGKGTVELSLPRLKHLYLCRPCEGQYLRFSQDYAWSTRADEASLAAWHHLLQASIKTLETLVLDHRVGAEYIERDGQSEAEFVKESYSGDGSASLVHMLETVLADGGGLLNLKKVYLYGIAVTEDPEDGVVSASVPAGRLMKSLEKQGLSWEARLGRWCVFDGDSSSTEWAPWGAETDEGEEDDCDDKSKTTVDTLLASG